MYEGLMKELENVPYFGNDAYEDLSIILKIKADAFDISDAERQRLNEELELIKQFNLSKIILFALDLVKDVRETCKVLSVENYLYINYLLGITDVNPVKYNFTYYRFFNERRRVLPEYWFFIKKGDKGKILNRLYRNYGENHFVKTANNKVCYFISQKDLVESEVIKETIINAKLNEETYKENFTNLTDRDLWGMNCYSFGLVEYDSLECVEKDFTEEEIYKKAQEIFEFLESEPFPLNDIVEITAILKDTNNIMVYQDQLLDILNKVCGFSYVESDYLRREMCKRKRSTLGEVVEVLKGKYGEEKGNIIFEYLLKCSKYSVSKGYVLAHLYNNIKFENIF